MAFMLRYFFSCLVDADFLATEAFMQPGLRPRMAGLAGPRRVLCDGAFAVLVHTENDYHPKTGLKRSGAPADPGAFFLW